MRPPASIREHLCVDGLLDWVKSSPDEPAYKRRMAVWLTQKGRLHAHKVAEILGVSVQAVRLWIGQYNKKGPAGLKRRGRGGRRRAFLSLTQECEILGPFIQRAQNGDVPRAAEIRPVIERALGRKVSMPYVYKLLSRHRWSQIIAQSHSVADHSQHDTFTRIARPWRRKPT